MNKLFGWDEISDELNEFDPETLDYINEEGGWRTTGWLEGEAPKVEVRETDRHVALQVWAKDKDEAHTKMLNSNHYCEYDDPK